MNNYILLNEYEQACCKEIYERIEYDDPDLSLEYIEQIGMCACEIADKWVTGQGENEDDDNVKKIFIDEDVQNFLAELYENSLEDDLLIYSYDYGELMEGFLYSLCKYLLEKDFSEPFDW